MKRFRKHLLIGMTALTLGAGSVAAYAHHPDCDGMGPEHGAAAHHEKFAERMKQRFEKRAADLHAKLKLSPAQETAWNGYLAKMRPEAPPARPNRAELDKLSAPERMEKMLTFMKAHENRMAERVAATKDFYATLTPQQQKIFNDEFIHHRHFGHREHKPG